MLRKTVNKLLGRFGFELRRSQPRVDAFSIQRELIRDKEPVIIDAGAHHGIVAKKYRELFPGAVIHCFEPFPESFKVLSNNLKADDRVRCHQAALSDVSGECSLNVNSASVTNSLLATHRNGPKIWGESLLETTERISVPVTTIDRFVSESEFAHIDILKLDVQGAEFSVFNGAIRTLRTKGCRLIYTELIFLPTYEGQHKVHEYLAFLDSVGYQLLDVFNPVRFGHQLIQADLIFVPC